MRRVLSENKNPSPSGKRRNLVRSPTFWDGCLFLLVAVLTFTVPGVLPGAGGTGPGGAEYLLVKTIDGTARVPLQKDAVHTVNGPLGPAKLIVKDGQASMESAPCPLKICEAMGPIKDPGQIILCIPNRISVKVEGRRAVDAISR